MAKRVLQVGPRLASVSNGAVSLVPPVTDLTADEPEPVDIDGKIQASIKLHFKSPADMGIGDYEFTGVVVHVQTTDRTTRILDSYTYKGAESEDVTIEVLQDYPADDEDWNVYVCSKSDKLENDLILNDQENSTPNVLVSVPAQPFTGGAPDVLAFHAGAFNQTTGLWSLKMKWNSLRDHMIIDWGCLLPSATLNWSGVAVFLKLPNGDVVQPTGIMDESMFEQTENGKIHYDAVGISLTDVPADPEQWEFIAVSYDRDGNPNTDPDGDPFGPSIKLMTLAPAAQPITEGGVVNITDAVGKITLGNIENLGEFNIGSFVGQLGIDRIGNVGTFRIENFTGNLPIGRIDNLGTLNINNFAGSLSSEKITSLKVDKLEGVIITQQLADGILNDLNKFAQDFRPITKVSSLPTLPNPGYPDKTIVLLTTTSTLYKNSSGSWATVSASDTVTGKISDGDVLTISAGKLIGQVNAANVTSIRVDQLTGSLSVGQANSVNVQTLNGNWDCSRLTNVSSLSIGSLSGNFDASRLTNLAAINITNLTGNLDASRLTNLTTLSIGSLSGNLDASRLTNLGLLSINTFSGTITNLNATSVNLVGQWNDGHISGIVAGKISAGTINVTGTGMTFSGSGGIVVAGGGNISVSPGSILGFSASFKSAGVGWDIIPGPGPYISSNSSLSYINAGNFRCNGSAGLSGVINIQTLAGGYHSFTFNGGILTGYQYVS
jgi:hypothetical protein